MDLDQLLAGVEGQLVEFKQSLARRREAMEALDGMINAEPAQGVVFFGVTPARQVVGVEPGDLDKAQRSLAQHIAATFQPPIQPVMELHDLEGKRLLALQASRHRGVPFHEYDGRAFIRIGSVCRQLTYEEKQHLQRSRARDLHPGPWRCDRCGSFVGMLISMAITSHGISTRDYSCDCGGEFWPA